MFSVRSSLIHGALSAPATILARCVTTHLLAQVVLFVLLIAGTIFPLRAQSVEKSFVNSIGQELVVVEPVVFQMGSADEEPGRDRDEQLRKVEIVRTFYVGRTEVTRGQFLAVMGFDPSESDSVLGSDRSANSGDENDSADYPVSGITWTEAVEFCEKLSKNPQELKAGRRYRLPTEVEWECACRAGSSNAFCFGLSEQDLNQFAWYESNSDGRIKKVAQKQASLFGLFDMHGNVWEWCGDGYVAERSMSGLQDSKNESRHVRVIRGGSAFSSARECRSASRAVSPKDLTSNPTRQADVGFRVVAEIIPTRGSYLMRDEYRGTIRR